MTTKPRKFKRQLTALRLVGVPIQDDEFSALEASAEADIRGVADQARYFIVAGLKSRGLLDGNPREKPIEVLDIAQTGYQLCETWWDEMPITRLRITTRGYNALLHAGINTVGEVLEHMSKGVDAMLKIRNFGQVSYIDLLYALVELGFSSGESSKLWVSLNGEGYNATPKSSS